MLGDNLVGNMTFAISNTSGSTGRYFLFHEGAFSSGIASGFVDSQSNIVTGAFGAGTITNSIDPSNDYATGGWQAFVVDEDSFQFLGQGTLTSSVSNTADNASQDNFSVSTLDTTINGTTITETQTFTSTSDQNAQLSRDVTPFFVIGYRSSTSSITFPSNVILEGN